jgi:hypothetical protein
MTGFSRTYNNLRWIHYSNHAQSAVWRTVESLRLGVGDGDGPGLLLPGVSWRALLSDFVAYSSVCSAREEWVRCIWLTCIAEVSLRYVVAVPVEDEGDLVADCGFYGGWCECEAILGNLDCVDAVDNELALMSSTILVMRRNIRCRSEHWKDDGADDGELHVERVTLRICIKRVSFCKM